MNFAEVAGPGAPAEGLQVVSRAVGSWASGAEQKCTTEAIGQRKCPGQLFRENVAHAAVQQTSRGNQDGCRCDLCAVWGLGSSVLPAVFDTVALAVHLQDVDVEGDEIAVVAEHDHVVNPSGGPDRPCDVRRIPGPRRAEALGAAAPTSRSGQRPVTQSRHSTTWAAGVQVPQVHAGTGTPVRLGLRAVHPGHPPATMFLRGCSVG